MTGRRGIWIAGIGLAVVLVLFGIQLHDTQTTMRRDIEARFRDRAEVTSALTDSVFSAIASPQSAAPYRTPVVSDALLDTAVAKGQLHYAVLLDGAGRTIASSHGFTQTPRAASLAGSASLRRVLQGGPYSLSDVLPSGHGGTIELAIPFQSAQREAHGLKGSSATLGAVRLATACAALEQAGADGDLARALTLVAELVDAAGATRAALEASLDAPTAAPRPL